MNALFPPKSVEGELFPTREMVRPAPDIIRDGASEASELESFLLGLWQRVLGVAEISRDDNFFDLGGDSLMAVNLFLEIEKQTGVNLPITAIYDAPTIAEMAGLIVEGGVRTVTPAFAGAGSSAVTEPYSPLVLLKPGTGKSPLYIAHGIGGTVIELAALGKAIGIPDAVYAIQARGLDGRDPPHEAIEAMVDDYVRAVRAVQPYGPYRLCGYSFGGLIAMEMARRFAAQGSSVSTLILIDAYAHPSTWPFLSRLRMKLRRSVYLFGRVLRRSPLETLSRVLDRGRNRSQANRLHDWLLDQNPSLPLPLLQVREAGSAALRSYRPKPYTGRIMFLKARKRDTEFPDDPKRIWRPLALDIRFCTIPGGHRTIVTRHAESAAAAITACLENSPLMRRGGEGICTPRRGGAEK